MRFLIMSGDLVSNVVVWDGETPWSAPDNVELLEAPAGVGVGFRRDGNTWIAPPAPVVVDESDTLDP
jgi:hypothetical protein